MSVPSLQTFAINLRAELIERELTISELARMSGLSRQHVRNILQGEKSPTFTVADKIAQALEMETVDLLVPTPP